MPGEDAENALIARAEARVGTVIKEKWTIERVIGVGGMAVVYAATHRNKKRAAIKMLHPELSVDPDTRTRFLREGYVANTVDHPGAVRVDDDDVAEDGSAFLVMELLEGETVHARLVRKGGTLAEAETLALGDQLLDVLAAAHAKGIVHRDLKPENLFLDRSGQLKVLDFGIARLRETRGPATATRTGSLMGTPAFMAPEQARGRWDEVDGRTDLWAVGATMFTLITGRLVHEAETSNEALALAITQPPASVASKSREPLHPAVVELVDRALAYDKTNRYADAQEMQVALRAAYAALASDAGSRPRELSIPDAAPKPAPALTPSQTERMEAAAVPGATLQSASLTTGRAVTATPAHLQPPATRRQSPSAGLLALLGAVLGFVVVAGAVGVWWLASASSGSAGPSAVASAAKAPSVGAVAAVDGGAPAPLAEAGASAVADLAVSATGKAESETGKAVSGVGKALAPRAPGKVAGQAARPRGDTPAWLQKAAAAPAPAPAAAPLPAPPPKRDPFAKRK